jgi:hypothetical protein
MALPVPAIQWGATDIEGHDAPNVPARWHPIGTLPALLDAGALFAAAGGTGWEGKGGFQISLFGGGFNPPTPI